MNEKLKISALRIVSNNDCYDLKYFLSFSENIELSVSTINFDSSDLSSLREHLRKSLSEIPDIVIFELNLGLRQRAMVIRRINQYISDKIPVIILGQPTIEKILKTDILKKRGILINKPYGFQESQKFVDIISSFWFSAVKFPELVNKPDFK